MATSSITNNFNVSGPKQVEMFINAFDTSTDNPPLRTSIKARELTSVEEIIELMEKREKVRSAKG